MYQKDPLKDYLSRQTSIINDRNEEILNSNNSKTRKSVDNYRYSKRDFRRSDWPETFRSKMTRRFEHPASQIIYKGI